MTFRLFRRIAPPLLVLLCLAWLISARQPAAAPEDPFATINAARAAGHWSQMLYAVQSAALKGWTPALHRAAGEAWQGLGDAQQATAQWEAALVATPNDAALLRTLAQSYLDEQTWTAASDALKRLTQLDPADTWPRFHLGALGAAYDPLSAAEELLIARADPVMQPVVEDVLSAIGAAFPDALTAMRIGLAFAKHEQWAYAELAFEQATALDSTFAEAWAYRSLARDHQGKDGNATIQRAAQLEPDNAQVLYLYGLHLRSNGDDTASLGAFTLAVEHAPENPAYAAELGTAYQRLGQVDEAEYWLLQAVTLSQQDPFFVGLLEQFRSESAAN